MLVRTGGKLIRQPDGTRKDFRGNVYPAAIPLAPGQKMHIAPRTVQPPGAARAPGPDPTRAQWHAGYGKFRHAPAPQAKAWQDWKKRGNYQVKTMGQQIADMKPKTKSGKYTELKKFFEKESAHKKRLVEIMTKVSGQFKDIQVKTKKALDDSNVALMKSLQEDRKKLQNKFSAAQKRTQSLDKSIQKTFRDLGKLANANKDEIKAVIADMNKTAPAPKKVSLKLTSKQRQMKIKKAEELAATGGESQTERLARLAKVEQDKLDAEKARLQGETSRINTKLQGIINESKRQSDAAATSAAQAKDVETKKAFEAQAARHKNEMRVAQNEIEALKACPGGVCPFIVDTSTAVPSIEMTAVPPPPPRRAPPPPRLRPPPPPRLRRPAPPAPALTPEEFDQMRRAAQELTPEELEVMRRETDRPWTAAAPSARHFSRAADYTAPLPTWGKRLPQEPQEPRPAPTPIRRPQPTPPPRAAPTPIRRPQPAPQDPPAPPPAPPQDPLAHPQQGFIRGLQPAPPLPPRRPSAYKPARLTAEEYMDIAFDHRLKRLQFETAADYESARREQKKQRKAFDEYTTLAGVDPEVSMKEYMRHYAKKRGMKDLPTSTYESSRFRMKKRIAKKPYTRRREKRRRDHDPVWTEEEIATAAPRTGVTIDRPEYRAPPGPPEPASAPEADLSAQELMMLIQEGGQQYEEEHPEAIARRERYWGPEAIKLPEYGKRLEDIEEEHVPYVPPQDTPIRRPRRSAPPPPPSPPSPSPRRSPSPKGRQPLPKGRKDWYAVPDADVDVNVAEQQR